MFRSVPDDRVRYLHVGSNPVRGIGTGDLESKLDATKGGALLSQINDIPLDQSVLNQTALFEACFA